MKHLIEVEIKNIEVDQHYYSFEYSARVDNGELIEGEYDSDHSWCNDVEWFKKYLTEEGALKTVLEALVF